MTSASHLRSRTPFARAVWRGHQGKCAPNRAAALIVAIQQLGQHGLQVKLQINVGGGGTRMVALGAGDLGLGTGGNDESARGRMGDGGGWDHGAVVKEQRVMPVKLKGFSEGINF